jgi:hypothetical protein
MVEFTTLDIEPHVHDQALDQLPAYGATYSSPSFQFYLFAVRNYFFLSSFIHLSAVFHPQRSAVYCLKLVKAPFRPFKNNK